MAKSKGIKVVKGEYKIRPNKVNISEYQTKDVKTSGIKMRGAGAATKGTMCRGPMG
tara:strand:+ start:2191 stop:2358 length:168 start_codon:yes stop_codon:yes gene_type:complete